MISIVKKKNKIKRELLYRVIIKGKLFLFFNECDYFYVGDLRYKYSLSQLKDYIERLL